MTSYRQYSFVGDYLGEIIEAGDGNVWFTVELPGEVTRLTPGGQITSFPVTASSSSGNPLPEGLTVGRDGTIWTANTNDDSVSNISLSGALLSRLPVGSIAGPEQIAFGTDGNLWFTQFNEQGILGRLTPIGQYSGFPQAYYLADVIAAPDGNLWCSVPHAGVLRVTTAGVTTFFPDPLGNISGPLTVGSDGNVWAGSTAANGGLAIEKITTAGQYTVYDIPGYLGQAPSGIMLSTTALAGADGYIYFAAADVLGELTVGGVLVAQYTSPAAGPSESITSMALGSDDNLYYVDSGNNIIGVWVEPQPSSVPMKRAR